MALDFDGYPIEADLERLKAWELWFPKDMTRHESWVKFLTLLNETWKWGFSITKSGRLYLATGGWSGNEDTHDLLSRNFMFRNTWQYSKRGGLHVYDVPRRAATAFIEANPKVERRAQRAEAKRQREAYLEATKK